jgi:arylsulfatase A-like enzyme
LPLLKQRTFFWRTSEQDAALKGHWKYLNDGTQDYLFDLSVDAREQANFRELNPAMFNQLRSEFKRWDSTVLPAHRHAADRRLLSSDSCPLISDRSAGTAGALARLKQHVHSRHY